MDDSVTHVAGPAINIAGRVVQRCAVCGEMLVDTMGKLDASGDTVFDFWVPFSLIRVKDGISSVVLPEIPEDLGECLTEEPNLPEDACYVLVE